jgi:hypothetical protein
MGSRTSAYPLSRSVSADRCPSVTGRSSRMTPNAVGEARLDRVDVRASAAAMRCLQERPSDEAEGGEVLPSPPRCLARATKPAMPGGAFARSGRRSRPGPRP